MFRALSGVLKTESFINSDRKQRIVWREIANGMQSEWV